MFFILIKDNKFKHYEITLLYLKPHLMETPALLNINFHSNQAFHLSIINFQYILDFWILILLELLKILIFIFNRIIFEKSIHELSQPFCINFLTSQIIFKP
jgi:hypothetical protein